MTDRGRRGAASAGPIAKARAPALEIKGLNVYYGASHALQGVDLTLRAGVLSVVGRNGMGKTTLCKAIMGLVSSSSGSIRFAGRELRGLDPAEVARLGVGYVPQGRRLWRSLTVDEHLRLVSGHDGAWSIDRIYATFPRLAERKNNGGAQLSGGEQQMLAIGRALLLNPRLLVMDEPTEGLAPVIVTQVEDMLTRLGEEGDIDVLVIEQNIGVATAVADTIAIMVNGRINRLADAAQLAADRELQQRLLGVGRHAHDETPAADAATPAGGTVSADRATSPAKIYQSNPTPPTRWSQPTPVRIIEQSARTVTGPVLGEAAAGRTELRQVAPGGEAVVIVAGTLDTKGPELRYLRDVIKAQGVAVRLADLSTSGAHSGADIPAHQIAAFHPRGASGVFGSDRGQSVAAMAQAFERWTARQPGIRGMIGAGGSGGTAMLAPAMRGLPLGVPKIIVSTIASGDVRRYVGASDIVMMPSIADIQGLNAITRTVLDNAAFALAGMMRGRAELSRAEAGVGAPTLPALGITMFGVTTPCVQQAAAALADDYECLVFHATGIGGQSLEGLVDGGLVRHVLDITTTEVCDLLMGGIHPATEDRFGAMIRHRIPYVGACGALDMVNFGAPDTVPERYKGRQLYQHNPQVTLMRTTPAENAAMGGWIGERLNRMEGPVRFLLPTGGVSTLDAPGRPFHDPAADEALFSALESTVRATPNRQVIRSAANINDPAFVADLLAAFRQVNGGGRPKRRQTAR